MSAVEMRTADVGRGNGGVAARRAVVRWAWRLFRREWRQQALVLALLTVAVAAAICNAAIAYNLTPVAGNAEFGSVNHYILIDASDPAVWESDVAYAAEQFGTVDVITHRAVPIAGTAEVVDYRAQNPDGPYGGPMLDLRSGTYPRGPGEIAVTDGVATTFELEIGDPFALDGSERTVVGIVENPSDLGEEFALLDPVSAGAPDSVVILVDATFNEVFPFRAPSGATTTRSQRPGDEDVDAAVSTFATATVTMVLIALVASASFVVVAQRRLRQLGMLAAIGATEGLLRLVTVANGAIIGVAAALAGGIGGVAAWFIAVPRIEQAAGHRIDPFNLPWWLVAAGMLLAVVAAVGAAWWPAWAVARIPTILALSGRPPAPRPVRLPAMLATVLMLVGVAGLAGADQSNRFLTVTGTVALIVGVLLICPVAIRSVAWPVARLPVSMRLALRDLARYQARSGMALAAISLALGIAVATVIVATAAEHSADEGNLSERQIMVRIGDPNSAHTPGDFSPYLPERTSEEIEALEADVHRLSQALDGVTMTPLDVAIDPAMPPEPGFDGRPAVTLARFNDRGGKPGWGDVTLIYLATPELLRLYGVVPDSISSGAGIITVETVQLRFSNVHMPDGQEPDLVSEVMRIDRTYSSLPGSFILPEDLRARGWETMPFGWLVETDGPIASRDLATARSIAAEAGLTIETRDPQQDLADERSQATLTGILLALGVLGMTVGLIRSEATGDLRTLTATGATSMTRRSLTAATAGALALLGVALGMVGAYLALIAWYLNDIGVLTPVPVTNLVVLAAGLPLIAALAGWLLAGREPRLFARQPIS